MHLTYRLAVPPDLPFCDRMTLEGFADAPDLRAHVPAVWRRLMACGALILMLVEDEDRPAEARIVWHGGSIFVEPSFLTQAREERKPGLAAQIMARALEYTLPALAYDAVCRANSQGGLHLMGMHYTLDETLCPMDAWLVRAKAIEAYHASLEGYRLQEILIEAYGEQRRRLMEAGGFRNREQADILRRRAEDALDSHRPMHPYLMGITREEALADDGSAIASLFAYSPPRVFFKESQQEMLRLALSGCTDDELAETLCMSASTVKTRWRAIYERVHDAYPSLLAGIAPSADQKRGQEKRRHLLTYLRQHPEELRPILPPPHQTP